ncbi:MAG: hypothetical protein IKC49_00210 [Clostridia bacterium]|nr:hypothetical protein [Clostridia bacterium]
MDSKRLEELKVLYNTYCKDNAKNFLQTGKSFQDIVNMINDPNVDEHARSALAEQFFTDEFVWGFIFADLSKMDLSNVPVDHLMRIPFSSQTKWPTKDKLPKGFDPELLIQNAKDYKDNNLELLHRDNIDGRGIKVAYIDSPFNLVHQAFQGKKIEYNGLSSDPECCHFHGYAVADRVLSVAPNVDLVYYGCGDDNNIGEGGETVNKIRALKKILARIKDGEDIVAVGMSTSLEEAIDQIKDNDIRERSKKELEKLRNSFGELGVEIIDSPNAMSKFNYAYKLDPIKPNTDIDNFVPHRHAQSDILPHIIEADKVRPLEYTVDDYVYENNLGSASWMIPQVVGLYCLAKQINYDITFDEFADICRDTASKPNEHGVKLTNPNEIIKEIEYRVENNY